MKSVSKPPELAPSSRSAATSWDTSVWFAQILTVYLTCSASAAAPHHHCWRRGLQASVRQSCWAQAVNDQRVGSTAVRTASQLDVEALKPTGHLPQLCAPPGLMGRIGHGQTHLDCLDLAQMLDQLIS